MKTNSFLLLFPFFIPAIFALPNYKKYWLALQNVVTGKVLDHYAGESIAAYDGDITNHYHHWGMYEGGEEGYYVLQNRATGKVLDHYGGVKIAAYDDNFNNPYHKWRPCLMMKDYYSFKNLGSGKVLEQLTDGSIDAISEIMFDDPRYWRIIEIKE